MPVIPRRVGAADAGEGGRDLVVGILIHAKQHVVLFLE